MKREKEIHHYYLVVIKSPFSSQLEIVLERRLGKERPNGNQYEELIFTKEEINFLDANAKSPLQDILKKIAKSAFYQGASHFNSKN